MERKSTLCIIYYQIRYFSYVEDPIGLFTNSLTAHDLSSIYCNYCYTEQLVLYQIMHGIQQLVCQLKI